MIKKYEERYAQELSDLLKDYPMAWGDTAKETVVALINGSVVGVGSLTNNAFHPYRDYLKVYVQPESRKKGIGKSIFQALIPLSEPKRFQAAVSSKDLTAVAFLESCGFQVARKCYTPVLRNGGSNVESGSDYCFFNELDSNQQDQVIQLQLENYRQFHQAINPLSDTLTYDEWKEIVLEGIDEANSFVWIEERLVKAYVLCYAGEDKTNIDIGYVGGRDRSELEDYLSFYRQAADYLIAQFAKVEIEADDVDPFAFALLNTFSYDKSDSWDTYIYDTKGEKQ